MIGLSEHTVLMNKVIGLCTRTHEWPSVLRDLGYTVDWIEPTFLTTDGQKVNPDLSLSSNKLVHSLAVECKGGTTLSDEQLDRLTNISTESVRNKTSVKHSSMLKHELVFASTSEHKDNLASKIHGHINYPILIFSEVVLSKEGTFLLNELERAFSKPIKLLNNPPLSFIPFNSNDDLSIISLHVLRELVVKALRSKGEETLEINIDELLDDIFPFWSDTDESKKKELRNKVNSVLVEYNKRSLGNYLQKVKGKRSWRIVRSLQAFAKECNKIIDYLEKQRKLTDIN